MRGVGSRPKEFICRMDTMEPEAFQTVFHIIPRNHERSNASSLKYSRAIRDGRGGELDPTAMNRADRESFLEFCPKVTNYAFSEDFYETHPKIFEMANEEGFIAEISDRELLIEVARDLSNMALEELTDAVNDPVKLTEGLKKS
jgi:hypothetical protein